MVEGLSSHFTGGETESWRITKDHVRVQWGQCSPRVHALSFHARLSDSSSQMRDDVRMVQSGKQWYQKRGELQADLGAMKRHQRRG